ncbi:MAG: hypothetical protein HOQ11_10870, partial [Gemmatimonadaceae bacterium]|nr:hypothetical protein [Gemmatimonadaceae bacterium]
MTTSTLATETRAIDWPALAAELSTTLRDVLALAEIELPRDLARAEGVWKGTAATIETRAWRGDRIAYCRVARVEGSGLAIGNLLCVPDPRLRADGAPLPILGVDMVAIGEREAIVVADLSPLGSGNAAAAARMSAALDADPRVAGLPPIADLPAWA